MKEIWLPIRDWPAYEVSSLGRIRNAKKNRILKCALSKGYPVVTLYRTAPNFEKAWFLVHRLVCTAFHGDQPHAQEVAHGDGNRANPSADNLRWATRSENHADKKIHGTNTEGITNGRAKLSDSEAFLIRHSKNSKAELSRKFGVSETQITRIKRREQWDHIK